MRLKEIYLALANNSRIQAATAGVVTIATFAKSFVPFYLIGSTPIFVAACLLGLVLVAANRRALFEDAGYLRDILVVMSLLYAIVIASFLVNSIHRVPPTHLIGILLFHGLFLAFGFAAARSLKAVFAMLLVQALIYMIVVAQYTARFGDLMAGGYLHNIFGVEESSVYSFMATFHQQIGISLGLAVLAALGLGTKRIQISTLVASPLVVLFMFHIAARTGIAALSCALLFWAWANLWVRSRQAALLSAAILVLTAVIATAGFYNFAVKDRAVDAIAPDAVSRTIREIQRQDDPDLRLPIWERTWHRIVTEPNHLLLGHGIGSFPIDEGVGPPDWLLRKTEGAKHYPHNIHLDVLYESGLAGLLLFGILTLFPIVGSLRHWTEFSSAEKSAFALYVFDLASMQLSGAFAFDYGFQFFLAIVLGVIAARRKRLAAPTKFAPISCAKASV